MEGGRILNLLGKTWRSSPCLSCPLTIYSYINIQSGAHHVTSGWSGSARYAWAAKFIHTAKSSLFATFHQTLKCYKFFTPQDCSIAAYGIADKSPRIIFISRRYWDILKTAPNPFEIDIKSTVGCLGRAQLTCQTRSFSGRYIPANSMVAIEVFRPSTWYAIDPPAGRTILPVDRPIALFGVEKNYSTRRGEGRGTL